MLIRRLQLIFLNAAGTRSSISVQEPQDPLTGAEVLAAMQTIADKDVFDTGGGLTGVVGARIIGTETTEIDLGL